MSMQTYPCSGYVVKAEDYLKALGATDEEIKRAEDSDGDTWEALQELAKEVVKRGGRDVPAPVDLPFMLNDCDDCGDLEEYVWYFVFDDDQLFTKTPTEAASSLASLGVVPKHECWGLWG